MGPIGAAMGASGRISRGMEHNAHSILKRRPNLKHRDNTPTRPGRKFRSRSLRFKKDEWRTANTPSRTVLFMLSGFGIFIGMIILLIGLPASIPLPAYTVKGGPVSGLATVLIFGLTILSASTTGFIILCRSQFRATKGNYGTN